MSKISYHKLTIYRGGCSRKLDTSVFDITNKRYDKELRNIKLGN